MSEEVWTTGRMPEREGWYLVTVCAPGAEAFVRSDSAQRMRGEMVWTGHYSPYVVAWRALPAPCEALKPVVVVDEKGEK